MKRNQSPRKRAFLTDADSTSGTTNEVSYSLLDEVSLFIWSLNLKPLERYFIAGVTLICAVFLALGFKGDVPICSENEETFYISPALSMAYYNSLDPGTYINPASTLEYPLAAYYKILQWCVPSALNLDAYPGYEEVFRHMELIAQYPRLISMLATLCTIPVLYLLGRRWFGPMAGGIAATVFILGRLVVFYATVVRPDMLSIFFITLSLLVMDLLIENPKSKKLSIVLGLSTGLALSTRFFCLALVPPVVAVYGIAYLSAKQTDQKGLLLQRAFSYLITWFGTFAVTSPFVILKFNEFREQMKFEADSKFTDITGLSPLQNCHWYLDYAFPYEMGTVFTVLMLAGLFFALFDKRLKTRLFILTFLLFLLGTCLNPRHWERWTLPMMPIGSILIGYAILQGRRIIEWNFKACSFPLKFARNASIVLASAVLLWGSFLSFRLMLRETYLKTRMSAPSAMYYYLMKNIPKGTKIAMAETWDMPNVRYFNLKEDIWRPDFVPPRNHNIHLPQDLAREGYQYMLVNQWNRDFWVSEEAKKTYPREYKFYKTLSEKAPLVWDGLRPGDNDYILGELVGNKWSPLMLYDLRPLASDKTTEHEKI